MGCVQCNNCQQDELTYYCTDKNEFVIKEKDSLVVKEKEKGNWKKGNPDYEVRRRKLHKEIV